MTAASSVAVRERPILFSGAMVRALLDDRKTQTRRVVKLNPAYVERWKNEPAHMWARECPYGAPGDRLWVREAWTAQLEWPGEYHGRRLHWWHEVPDGFRGVKNAQRVYYQADGSEYEVRDFGNGTHDLAHNCDGVDDVPRWRPSIHMPRWACRLVLELTDVRVERLQDISEADAIAEGMTPSPGPAGPLDFYRLLWNELNYDRGFGWDANPWVWVLTFCRVAVSA